MTNPPEIGARSALGEAYLEGRLAQARLRGEFRPSRREDVTEIERLARAERSAAIARGIEALRRGEVAYGVLAAGASTRMNLAEVPPEAHRLLERAGGAEIKSKAMVPVVEIDGRVLSFLDLFLANVVRLSSETRTSCPIVLLVSEANRRRDRATRRPGRGDFAGSGFHVSPGARSRRSSPASPTSSARARTSRASATSNALSSCRGASPAASSRSAEPGGHGEFLHQLISSGTLARLLRRGVRYLSVRNIDNIGGLLDDRWLVILGRMIEAERNLVVEVSRRPDGPAGKGGALIVRPSGDFELAEDPAFAGTGIDPRESYYINNATAILKVEYLFRIYDTSDAEILDSPPAKLAEIADRGRRKFPVADRRQARAALDRSRSPARSCARPIFGNRAASSAASASMPRVSPR